MEILEFLLSYLASEYSGGKYEKLYNLLKENNFDFNLALPKLKLDTIAPIIPDVLGLFGKQKPQENASCGIEPIKSFANNQIKQSLDEYFKQKARV